LLRLGSLPDPLADVFGSFTKHVGTKKMSFVEIVCVIVCVRISRGLQKTGEIVAQHEESASDLSNASGNTPKKENKDSKKTEEVKNTNPFAFLIPNALAEVSSEQPPFRFWWIAISSPRVWRNLKRERKGCCCYEEQRTESLGCWYIAQT
jgi:hypothetical protein